MGATIRMTKDKRILIRNTAEVYNPYQMSKSELTKRSLNKRLELKKDFQNYRMILFNLLGQALFQEQEIVLKFLKKLMTIYLLQVVIMAQVLELVLYLESKLLLKQVMKIQKR